MSDTRDDEIESLKKSQGPGLFGHLAALIGPDAPNVRFIRRGYEAGIVDELARFYTQRPRPWRPARNCACGPTHKERLKASRRADARRR